jgi:glycosyltransferase involved in cell wall biosynthesis
MKIFFDARWTRTTRHDGVSRYGSNLVGALAKLHPVTMIIHDKAQLKLLPEDVPYVVLNHPFSPKELFIARKLNKLGADVVFTPLQYMGWMGRKYKLIYTLQDLIYYQYPEPPRFLPWYVKVIWRLFHITYWPQRWILHRADSIATVSETSRRYIQRYITSREVVAVRNAPQAVFKNNKTSVAKIPTKDIVFMGSFMPYKNVECLVRGLEYLPDYTLHLLSPITNERKAELQALAPKKAKITFWNGISDEDYKKLLGHAVALVSASKAEGFGLPLVEAMAEGVPIVCSDIEPFHEVADTVGLFFNPDDPKDFASKVLEAEKPEVRSSLIEKGPKQAATFSWEKSAKTLLDMMNTLYSRQ